MSDYLAFLTEQLRRSRNTLAFGHEVIAHREGYQKQPYIEIHKMGSSDRSWFTPTEARTMSALLALAADVAEGKIE